MPAGTFSPGHCGTCTCASGSCAPCACCPGCGGSLSGLHVEYTSALSGSGTKPLGACVATTTCINSGSVGGVNDHNVTITVDLSGATPLLTVSSYTLTGCGGAGGNPCTSPSHFTLVSFTCNPFYIHWTANGTCPYVVAKQYTDIVVTL